MWLPSCKHFHTKQTFISAHPPTCTHTHTHAHTLYVAHTQLVIENEKKINCRNICQFQFFGCRISNKNVSNETSIIMSQETKQYALHTTQLPIDDVLNMFGHVCFLYFDDRPENTIEWCGFQTNSKIDVGENYFSILISINISSTHHTLNTGYLHLWSFKISLFWSNRMEMGVHFFSSPCFFSPFWMRCIPFFFSGCKAYFNGVKNWHFIVHISLAF